MSGPSTLTGVRRPALLAMGTLAAVFLLVACASSGQSPRAASAAASSASRSASTSQHAAAQATATVRHVFAPLDPGGAPPTGVAAHRSGTCFTSSITVRDRFAFRCFAANQILDPCFAGSGSAQRLYCYADPWSKPTALRLTKALPAPVTVSAVTRPWALELVGGNRCLVLTGTVPEVHGISLGYRCDTGTAGLTSATGVRLSAFYRAPAGTLVRVSVVAVWSG